MKEDNVLEKLLLRSINAYCLSKALSEDYARIVGKLENVPELEVLNRVQKRAFELFEEIKTEANQMFTK
ncbi:MAG TPA: hypothetical protein VD884_19065 [Ohtaekwangia sp.]|nr:hypothetical protein [Ohtaekwangia sp.]